MTRATDEQDVREQRAYYPRAAASAARFAARNRAAVLLVALGLVVAAAFYLAKARFESSPSVEPLRMARFLAKRSAEYDAASLAKLPPVLVVVEKAKPDLDDATFNAALDAIAQDLLEIPETRLETVGLDDASFNGKRAYFYSKDELEDAVELGRIAQAIARGDVSPLELPAVVRQLSDDPNPEAIAAFASEASQAFDPSFRALNLPTASAERDSEPPLPDALKPEYWRRSEDGALAMATLEFIVHETPPNAYRSAPEKDVLAAVDAACARAAERSAEVRCVATGLAALDRAEANALRPVLTRAMIVGAVVLVLLFWIAFSRLPRAAICLATSAAPVLAVEVALFAFNGRLQPRDLLAAFPALAFAISASSLWFAQYGRLRRRIRALEVAVETTNALVGRAIVCAALALVCGAVALALSSEASRPVGLALALGALVSLAATLIVAPAAIILCESARPFKSATPPAKTPFAFALRRPKLVRALAILAVAPFAVAAPNIDRAPTSLGLVDADLPERVALDRATEALGFYPALRADVMLDESDDDFPSVKNRLAEDGSVVVDDPFATAPKISADQKAIVGDLASALEPLAPAAPSLPAPDRDEFLKALDALDASLQFYAEGLTEAERFDYDAARAALADARRAVDACEERDFATRAQRFQLVEALDLLKRLFTLRDACSVEPPTLDDLSPALQARRVDPATGRPTLRVYSRKDLTQRSALTAFVGNVGVATPESGGSAFALFDRASDANAALIFALAIWTLALIASNGWSLGSFGAGLLACLPSLAALGVSLGLATRLKVSVDEISFIEPIAVLLGASVLTRAFDLSSQASESAEGDAEARYSSPSLAGETTGAALGWFGASAFLAGYLGWTSLGAWLATSALGLALVAVFATPAVASLRSDASIGLELETRDDASNQRPNEEEDSRAEDAQEN